MAIWRTIIRQQFGAAVDMLDNALSAYPDELWRERLCDHPEERPEYAQLSLLLGQKMGLTPGCVGRAKTHAA